MRVYPNCHNVIPNNVAARFDGKLTFCSADCNYAYNQSRKSNEEINSTNDHPSEGLIHLLPVGCRFPAVLLLGIVSSVIFAIWLGSVSGLILGGLFLGIIYYLHAFYLRIQTLEI